MPSTRSSTSRARRRPAVRRRAGSAILATGALLALPGLAFAAAQEAEPPDSTTRREAAEEAQTKMERFREERIPPDLATGGGTCDDLIGRMCLRYESGADHPLGEEPPQVDMARRDVLAVLDEAGRALPGDAWILGQRVFYRTESGAASQALALAEGCGVPEEQRWWCDALRGYALHAQASTAEADAAFDAALARMPAEERARWLVPTWLLDGDGSDLWKDTSADARAAIFERMWLLADPLYLVPLNDRRTEHYARRTLVLIQEEAQNPFGLEWEEDLEQLTVRYGGPVAWERERRLPSGNPLQDTRRIIGRHHPESRDYVPPGEVLAQPEAVRVGVWNPEYERPRTGYAPPYAPVIEPLSAQVARFRRGDSLLVVAAFAPRVPDPAPTRRVAAREQPRVATDPFRTAPSAAPEPEEEPEDEGVRITGPVEAGVFLVAPDGGQRLDVRSENGRDVLTLLGPNGAWIVGAEVWEPRARRAWRARGGLSQAPAVLGVPAVSDLLVLDAAGGPPGSFEEALPRARADLRLRVDEPFGLAWEVYGLRVGETASVAIGFSQGSPGLLRRAGEFLRLVQPSEPVVLSWEDAGPDRLGTVFRSVDLTLPELDAGEYTIHLEIILPGREPIVASRAIEIIG